MKMALEQAWEAKFAPNTYGFRPGRSCHDAIEAILITMVKKTAYVLDADIAECFDKIDQNLLLEKLNTTPTFKRIIKGWLKAGVMEDRKFISTPQGYNTSRNNISTLGLRGTAWIGRSYQERAEQRTFSVYEKEKRESIM